MTGLAKPLAFALYHYSMGSEINKMLNGFPLEQVDNHIVLDLICLCFAAVALRQLAVLSPMQTDTPEYQAPLVRYDNTAAWFKYPGRATMLSANGAVSTSYTNAFANSPRANKWVFFNRPPLGSIESAAYQFDRKEHEVLIPPGAQLITVAMGPRESGVRIINSPAMPVKMSRKLALALRHAFQEHFPKNPSQQEPTDLAAVKKYGVAHMTRKLFYVEVIIDYFKSFASNQAFRHFCDTMDKTTLELIKTMLIFSETGRVTSDDKTLSRETSAKNFSQYAKKWGYTEHDMSQLEKLICRCDSTFLLNERQSEPNDFILQLMILTEQFAAVGDNHLSQFESRLSQLDTLTDNSDEQAAAKRELAHYVIEGTLITQGNVSIDICKKYGVTWQAASRERTASKMLDLNAAPCVCEAWLAQVPAPWLRTMLSDALPAVEPPQSFAP